MVCDPKTEDFTLVRNIKATQGRSDSSYDFIKTIHGLWAIACSVNYWNLGVSLSLRGFHSCVMGFNFGGLFFSQNFSSPNSYRPYNNDNKRSNKTTTWYIDRIELNWIYFLETCITIVDASAFALWLSRIRLPRLAFSSLIWRRNTQTNIQADIETDRHSPTGKVKKKSQRAASPPLTAKKWTRPLRV